MRTSIGNVFALGLMVLAITFVACSESDEPTRPGIPGDTLKPHRSGGISGFSGIGGATCTGCHSPTGNPLPVLALNGPTTLAPGATGDYVLTLDPTEPTDQTQGGFNLAVSGGTLVPGAGSHLLDGELAHSGPQGGTNVLTWNFQWQAPASAGTYEMFVAGVSGNGSGTGGDEVGVLSGFFVTVESAPVNEPPVANAGPDQMVTDSDDNGMEMVTLNGSGSTDDGTIVSWEWYEAGSPVASGEIVNVDLAVGEHTITLMVTDDGGLTASDEVVVTVKPFTPVNEPPVANAGPDQMVTDGDDNGMEMVTLNGSGSTDDGTIVSWEWYEAGSPVASGEIAAVNLVLGSHTLTLVVTDDGGLMDADEVVITVNPPAPGNDGARLYADNCGFCHGDPQSMDPPQAAPQKVGGARDCSIEGAIYGTSVFPGGVPDMQYLQGVLGADDITRISEYLNSFPVTGQQRYESACAGCHGMDGKGGRTGEGVLGASAHEIAEAIREESEMRYLSCMPHSDLEAIAMFLESADGDDEDSESSESSESSDHDDEHSGPEKSGGKHPSGKSPSID